MMIFSFKNVFSFALLDLFFKQNTPLCNKAIKHNHILLDTTVKFIIVDLDLIRGFNGVNSLPPRKSQVKKIVPAPPPVYAKVTFFTFIILKTAPYKVRKDLFSGVFFMYHFLKHIFTEERLFKSNLQDCQTKDHQ